MANGFQKKWQTVRRRIRKGASRVSGKVNAFRLPVADDIFKLTVKLAFIAAVAAAAAFAVITEADLSPSAVAHGFMDKRALDNASGEGFPFRIVGSRAVSAQPLRNGTAVLTDTTYTVLDRGGREISSQAHYMASPVMQTADRYSLLFDRAGNAYALKTLSGSLCTGKTDHAIVAGAVSRSGNFALVTDYDTAHSYVRVYNKHGKAIHNWKSNSYHISDIAISPSGHYIAVCGVAADGGRLISAVIIQKVGGNTNLREYVFEDTFLFAVEFTGDGSAVAVGDDQVVRLSVGEQKALPYSFNGLTLTGYDINGSGQMALALSAHSDGQNAGIIVINDACAEILSLSTTLDSPAVELTDELTGGRINLISRSKFYSYSLSGKLLREADIPADSQSVLTSGGKVLIKGVTVVSEAD